MADPVPAPRRRLTPWKIGAIIVAVIILWYLVMFFYPAMTT